MAAKKGDSEDEACCVEPGLVKSTGTPHRPPVGSAHVMTWCHEPQIGGSPVGPTPTSFGLARRNFLCNGTASCHRERVFYSFLEPQNTGIVRIQNSSFFY